MKRETVLQILVAHQNDLQIQFGVNSLALFGSVARGESTDDSDVDLLVEFTRSMSFEQFCDDPKTLKAVALDFVVIGETAGHVPDDVANAHPEIAWSLMRGMRKRLVHDYFGIDPQILWDTIPNNLPSLVGPLGKLL
jgi:uncharacterized protein with HEPN domain